MAELLLGVHVLTGLLGSFAPVGVLLETFKPNPSVARAKFFAFCAFFLLVVSWLAGGAYYVGVYGSDVKPVIKAAYPWVHSIVMESKEHLFLFMPVLAALLLVLVWKNLSASRLARFVSVSIIVLGLIMAIGGKIISGAYEKKEAKAPKMPVWTIEEDEMPVIQPTPSDNAVGETLEVPPPPPPPGAPGL